MADLTAPLTELLDLLAAADVRATMNPGEVETPGAWLSLEEVTTANVAGQDRLACALYLITGDTDALRALGQLSPELAKVRTVLTPDGPVTTTAVVLPSGPTPLPALRVPVHLYTGSE